MLSYKLSFVRDSGTQGRFNPKSPMEWVEHLSLRKGEEEAIMDILQNGTLHSEILI